MTHGGFCNHVDFREALVYAAPEHPAGHASTGDPRRAADAYLIARHRDELATACPLSCLWPGLARGSAKLRRVFTEGSGKGWSSLAPIPAVKTAEGRRRGAILAASSMIPHSRMKSSPPRVRPCPCPANLLWGMAWKSRMRTPGGEPPLPAGGAERRQADTAAATSYGRKRRISLLTILPEASAPDLCLNLRFACTS
jgi:hypothetical protein